MLKKMLLASAALAAISAPALSADMPLKAPSTRGSRCSL